MFHTDNGSAIGSVVNGGVFHLINASASVGGNPVWQFLPSVPTLALRQDE